MEMTEETKWEAASDRKWQEIRYAFLQSVPVLLGYLFLGIAFGLMLQNAGYHFVWAFFCSLFIYAGSGQFVMVSLLSSGAGLLYTAIMTLFINGRHIFYGLSFIEKFKKMGKAYPYMIFSLTDETYSVLCSLKVPPHLREKKVAFYIALFDHSYWIVGSVIGCLAGQLIAFDSTGVDFSMTALFIVIVLNQWQESKSHIPALLGALSGVVFLVILGPDKFLLPALGVVAILLVVAKSKIQKEEILSSPSDPDFLSDNKEDEKHES